MTEHKNINKNIKFGDKLNDFEASVMKGMRHLTVTEEIEKDRI